MVASELAVRSGYLHYNIAVCASVRGGGVDNVMKDERFFKLGWVQNPPPRSLLPVYTLQIQNNPDRI